MEKIETIPQTFTRKPVFRRLEKVAQYAVLTEKERKAYKESLKVYRDNYAIAETERAEGKAEGIAEAIAEKSKKARELGISEDVIAKIFGSKI